jgi:hypothetical protein
MAHRDVRGVLKGTRGRVIGMKEPPCGGDARRILWLAEELQGRQPPFVEWVTNGEDEQRLTELTYRNTRKDSGF